MSQVTTHQCDRCGDKRSGDLDQLRPWQLYELQFSIYSMPRYQSLTPTIGSCTFTHAAVHWCRKCMEEYNLLGRIKPATEEVVPEITFEERLREFIRSEVQQ